MAKDHTIRVRMSANQHEQLEAFQRRTCAPTLSAAIRIALARGLAGLPLDAAEPGTVDDAGRVVLAHRMEEA